MDEDERLEELLNEMDSDELDAAFERAMDAALERTMEAEMNLEAALSGSLHYGHIDTDLLFDCIASTENVVIKPNDKTPINMFCAFFDFFP